jgi:hypothetical protein
MSVYVKEVGGSIEATLPSIEAAIDYVKRNVPRSDWHLMRILYLDIKLTLL